MQQMEATRLAAEDAHRQHMEALRQLEENRAAALVFGPKPRPVERMEPGGLSEAPPGEV